MNNLLKKTIAVTATMASLGTAFAAPIFANEFEPESSADTVSMYRLYNKNTGEHFYTADTNERKTLLYCGWKDEGIGWFAPTHSNTPVYRLYNPNAGDHHYTMYPNERNHLIKVGWKDEGIGWYSDDAKTVPMYREYNPNAKVGTHNYTCSQKEHGTLIQLGWKDENIAWYAVESGAPIEKGHFEQVWIEGKTEKVPIVEKNPIWICDQCGYKEPDPAPGMSNHAYQQHYLKGEDCHFWSDWEEVVVGYNTVETPGHYEWKWVAD